jgi:hypothetical protein
MRFKNTVAREREKNYARLYIKVSFLGEGEVLLWKIVSNHGNVLRSWRSLSLVAQITESAAEAGLINH